MDPLLPPQAAIQVVLSPASGSSQTPPSSVRFGSVEVRTYPVTLGDNPGNHLSTFDDGPTYVAGLAAFRLGSNDGG